MDYNSIELTPEEIEAAILEGKKKKFFRLRNADYWKDLDLGKDSTEYYFKPSLPGIQKSQCSDPSASPAPGHGFRA